MFETLVKCIQDTPITNFNRQYCDSVDNINLIPMSNVLEAEEVDALERIHEKEYQVISLDANPVLLENMKKAWTWKTVPMVFEFTDNDPSATKFVGGYTDLKSILTNE